MKTLVYSSIATWSGRIHVLLAVAQESIDRGDQVVFVRCDASLPCCVTNLNHSRAICRYCMARSLKGLARVSGAVTRRVLSDYLEPDERTRIVESRDALTDHEALRDWEYEGSDLGYAALSSYTTATREPAPDLGHAATRETVQRLLNSGKLVHAAMSRALQRERPDRVVMFNGRLAADRAVLRCCEVAGIPCDVYEITQKHDHVTFFRNALTGNIRATAAAIEQLWEGAPQDKVRVAQEFFEKTRHGVFTNDLIFVDRQTSDEAPQGWNDERHNIVIFGSSEDEFAAISREWDEKIYPGQAEAVRRICDALADAPELHVTLRLHPHMKDLDRPYARELRALDGTLGNLTVIQPESPINSYALLDRASTVVTFGSTMGIEAVYWGRPSVLLVNCFYKLLGATYNPESHDEVLALLRTKLAAKERTPALKMAYYRMKNGFRQPHFDGDRRLGSRRGYLFKGDRIAVRGFRRLGYKLAKKRGERLQR